MVTQRLVRWCTAHGTSVRRFSHLRFAAPCRRAHALFLSSPCAGQLGGRTTRLTLWCILAHILARILATVVRGRGRVTQKSRRIVYGTTDKKNAAPCFFHFRIADSSRPAGLRVCVWGSLCLSLWSSLEVGQPVVVRRWKVGHHRGELEAKLNDHKTRAELCGSVQVRRTGRRRAPAPTCRTAWRGTPAPHPPIACDRAGLESACAPAAGPGAIAEAGL